MTRSPIRRYEAGQRGASWPAAVLVVLLVAGLGYLAWRQVAQDRLTKDLEDRLAHLESHVE